MLKDVLDDTSEKWEVADVKNFERMKEFTEQRDEKVLSRMEKILINVNEQFLKGMEKIWETKSASHQSTPPVQMPNQFQQPVLPQESRPLSNVTNYNPYYPHPYYPKY